MKRRDFLKLLGISTAAISPLVRAASPPMNSWIGELCKGDVDQEMHSGWRRKGNLVVMWGEANDSGKAYYSITPAAVLTKQAIAKDGRTTVAFLNSIDGILPLEGFECSEPGALWVAVCAMDSPA